MSAQNSGEPASKSNSVLSMISFALFILYGLFIEWYWGWKSILSEWSRIGSATTVIAVSMLVATYFIRCHRIQNYFSPATDGAFFRLFRLTQIHNLLNIMLPFRVGEASFPVLMRREFSQSLATSTAALLVMRLLDIHALASAGLLGLALALPSRGPALAAWAVFVASPVLLFLVKKRVMAFFARILPDRLESLVLRIDAGLPGDIGRFMRAWFLTLANWLIKIFVIAFIFRAFSGAPLLAALGSALGGELSAVTPFHAPGGIGSYPAGMIAGALSFGAGANAAMLDGLTRAAVNVHLMIIVSALAGTGLALIGPGAVRRS